MKVWTEILDSWAWARPVRAIGGATFREILRDKLLYNLGALGGVLVLVSLLASQLAVRAEGRVLVDLGILGFSVTLGMIAVFMGSAQFAREIERRTFHIALSRPISRLQFVLGKYLGLAAVMTLNAGVLASVILLVFFAMTGSLDHPLLGGTFIGALILEWLQSLTLLGLAFLFSSFSTTSLSVVMTLGCFAMGANTSQLRWLAVQPGVRETVFSQLLESVASVVPNFELFDVDSWASYGLSLPPRTVALATLYTLAIVSAALCAASIAIQGRENG